MSGKGWEGTVLQSTWCTVLIHCKRLVFLIEFFLALQETEDKNDSEFMNHNIHYCANAMDIVLYAALTSAAIDFDLPRLITYL